MSKKQRDIRISFWTIFSKFGKTRLLIEAIVDLAEYIRKEAADPMLQRHIDRIDSLLDDMFG